MQRSGLVHATAYLKPDNRSKYTSTKPRLSRALYISTTTTTAATKSPYITEYIPVSTAAMRIPRFIPTRLLVRIEGPVVEDACLFQRSRTVPRLALFPLHLEIFFCPDVLMASRRSRCYREDAALITVHGRQHTE
ncbi:uncharacterized protein MYCFIDRAFT_211064 [Pseudocercospora fijiensis CIRAD86]|uniref:Uncharacterized protein n=1 Tax=Pseudocercospora fijiensis (strain CIRAD86) TaxID=383855 RepID=M3B766_PSEFD|nr:uncharacterized protein MYCFIDRAFT_211064 [Pseudocercospora fijiensis CIRAD86]EME85162.1 hypothetical protein MYCFIDRAFT_211064 [Pseudocercospora fijiensis CIRAD86]